MPAEELSLYNEIVKALASNPAMLLLCIVILAVLWLTRDLLKKGLDPVRNISTSLTMMTGDIKEMSKDIKHLSEKLEQLGNRVTVHEVEIEHLKRQRERD